MALILLLLVPATVFGAKEAIDKEFDSAFSAAYRSPNPLTAPESRSPKELLQTFNQLADEIRDVFRHSSEQGDITPEQEERLIGLYGEMSQLIDASVLPKSERFARTNAALSQLAEVIARVPLPPLQQIPDTGQVSRQALDFWRIPGTTIALQRITKGPREDDWIFFDETVKNADALYKAAIAEVPPAPGDQTLLEHYLTYSGPLISARLTDAIPKALHRPLLGQPLWKFFGAALIVLLLLVISLSLLALSRWLVRRMHPESQVRRNLLRLIVPAFLVVVIPIAIDVIAIDLRLRLSVLDGIDDLLWLWFYAVATWALLIAADLVAAIIIRSPSISPEGIDASMVRLTCRLIAYGLAIWVWVEGLQALGLSLIPLLAGVSVGGLAFALAAKPTLGNLLGGVILFADKPFRVGHRVVVGDHQGIIEEIGLRSTRLRTLDGHLVSLPNDEVCASSIENIALRPNIKRLLNITLTYDTPPAKIERAIEIVRQLLSIEEDGGLSEEELGRPSNWHLHTDDENLKPRVYFSDLNADSLNILVIYWFSPPDYWVYLEHATWLNLQLIERFNAEGIEFAFPTQTIDLKPREGTQADPAIVASPDR